MQLQRYNFNADCSWNLGEPVKHEAGEYVKWADVERLVLAYVKNLTELDKFLENDTYRMQQQAEDDEALKAAKERIEQLHVNYSATEAQRQKVIVQLKEEKIRGALAESTCRVLLDKMEKFTEVFKTFHEEFKATAGCHSNPTPFTSSTHSSG